MTCFTPVMICSPHNDTVARIWAPSMGLDVVQPRHRKGVLSGSLLPAEVTVWEHLVMGSVVSKDPQGFQHTLAVSLA